MYTEFYQLKQKPFQISSDPSFIWLGEKHKEALATLRYSVIDNKGLMLLTGDVGTGKTTLINTLLKSLGKDVYYASVPDPRLELIDFLNYVGQAFHIDNNFESKGSFLIHFGWFLESVYKQKKKALLIIDEAQLLTQNLLEEIRLLSNINRDGNHLLNIFFVGQNEFNEILHRPENRAVTQRITLNYQIDQLSEEETALYIQHRLRVAGAAQPIFTVSAMKAIFRHSQGIPRRINVISDHCLLTGYTEGNVTIDEKIVEDCVRDIAIPHYKRSPDPDTEKAQSPAGAETSKRFRPRWLQTFLLLLLVLLLSSVLALLMSNSRDVSGTLVSAYQNVMGYLSPASSSNTTLQKPQSVESAPTTSGPAKDPETVIHEPVNTVGGAAESADTSTQAPARQNTFTTPPPPSEDQAAGTTALQAAGNPQVAEPASGTIGSGADTEQREPVPITRRSETGQDDERSSSIMISTIESQTSSLPGLLEKEAPVQGQLRQPGQGTGSNKEDTLNLHEGPVVIRFERNSNDLSASNLDQLIQLGLSVKNRTDVSLKISGYTDSAGSVEYNNQLSLIRANMVKSYLLGLGVQADRMDVHGLGSRSPVAENTTEQGRRLNRRVEIEVVAP